MDRYPNQIGASSNQEEAKESTVNQISPDRASGVLNTGLQAISQSPSDQIQWDSTASQE